MGDVGGDQNTATNNIGLECHVDVFKKYLAKFRIFLATRVTAGYYIDTLDLTDQFRGGFHMRTFEDFSNVRGFPEKPGFSLKLSFKLEAESSSQHFQCM